MNITVVMQQLVGGMGASLLIFVLTLLFSMPLGLAVAFGRMSKFKPLQAIVKVFIAILRGTPLMLQLLVVFFGPYYVFGWTLPRSYRFIAVILGFAINYAAYFAEIYRGGINSIDRGQYEAAHSLGLSKGQTMMGIILPQTMKTILPPVSNEAIVLIKDTALVSCIGVADLMKASESAVNRDVNAMAYLVAAVIYLIFTFLLTLLSNYLERRYSVYDAKED